MSIGGTDRDDLPTGTVTFLFTDIEGSTRLLHELGPEAYAIALDRHRQQLRGAFAAHGGVEVDTEGDAFFVAFPDPAEAVAAAQEAQEALSIGPIRVRMGLHTGTPHVTAQGYVGIDVHKGARIAASSHGGQVVISRETRTFLGQRFDFIDLGEHRLKDLGEPAWIYQLGTERFPPLKTISNTNVPRPTSSFVGRDREVKEIGALLRDGARLVTLTGPGGTGKTRLAIEAATELVPAFKNGVFWVDLAPLRDPALVAETIGRTLGAKDGLAEHIGEREMLLLLDNLEQVVSAAPDLAALAETCPNLRLLVTSRERLRVRGEVEFAVLPLANAEAVNLFCERAQLAPDGTIAELCRRLDDLPLAVELAAARASVMSPDDILRRLAGRLDLLKGGRDAGARQRTLRATIEWSHDLLASDEKILLARLSVFRGGWTMEAAEEIVDADIDTLASLVDKSLVRRRDERLTMLESVRQFSTEKLALISDASAVERGHAEYFLALAEEAEPHMPAYDREWVERLEAEHDNLRAAFDFYQQAADGQAMQRLVGALARFWFMRGHAVEARRRIGAALAADDAETAARASGMLGAAYVSPAADETEYAAPALALFRHLGDRRGEALAQLLIGDTAAADGDWTRAAGLVEDSLAVLRDIGEEHHALIAARGLGWIYMGLGDRERGMRLHRETLRRAQELGNKRIEAVVTGAIAMGAIEEGRLEEAAQLLLESQRLHAALGDPFAADINVFRFAALLLARGHAEAAARLSACADALIAELGLTLREWDPEWVDQVNARLHESLDEAALTRAREEGSRMTAEAAIDLALAALDDS